MGTQARGWALTHEELPYSEIKELVSSAKSYFDGLYDKRDGFDIATMLNSLDRSFLSTFEFWEFPNKNRMGQDDQQSTYAITQKT